MPKSEEELFLINQKKEFKEDGVNLDSKFIVKVEMKNFNIGEAEKMYNSIRKTVNLAIRNTRFREQIVTLIKKESKWSKPTQREDIICQETERLWNKGELEKGLNKGKLKELRKAGKGLKWVS